MKPFSKPYRSICSYFNVAKVLARNQLVGDISACEGRKTNVFLNAMPDLSALSDYSKKQEGPPKLAVSEVDKFSKKFHDLIGQDRCEFIIPTGSGTQAIKLAFALLNYELGRATYLPDSHRRTSVRIFPNYYPMVIDGAINQGGGVIVRDQSIFSRANYFVENYGLPADARITGALRILDCSQSVIPETKGFFDFYVWDFGDSMPLSCGEGGALGVNLSRLRYLNKEKALTLAGYGLGKMVSNFRMPEISAAFLRGQLSSLESIRRLRRKLFIDYNKLFGCFAPHETTPLVPWCYPAKVKGLPAGQAGLQRGSTDINWIETRKGPDGRLLLPIHQGVTKNDIYRLYETLKPFLC